MSTIEINPNEHGVIRVFSVSRPIAQMAGMLAQSSKADVAAELLNAEVAPSDIELFALSDLAGMGLAPYLTEGHGIESATLKPDRARLEALDGYVLIYRPTKPFNDVRVLRPSTDLTLIGTYAEPRSSRAAAPIKSDAAAPYSAAKAPEGAPRKSRAGSLMVAAVILLMLLVIWWVAS